MTKTTGIFREISLAALKIVAENPWLIPAVAGVHGFWKFAQLTQVVRIEHEKNK
ncbi:hypothetical protein [Lapidilactobacillus gannanensis]|uniref:Uncharacterized protein n=1 Tax=Lapidilactobacillus gannanensis TaxID=2486002 RepID=A0ABW4BQY5_9LACO|nr:hypothetical protein [Lapidilactobacillus gannanensis]